MIILDTHAWIWWADAPSKLSSKARAAMEGGTDIGIAAISCWELAMLVARGRLQLDRDVLVWIRDSLALPKVRLFPLSPEVAVLAAGLGRDFPGDPADRLIVSTALVHNAKLISKDQRIRSFKQASAVW
ncbi:MAG: type II toxin-antitoxin system VapC family toxin [Planctomycetes bacterium]|nr:type II toxin-antitoxin system VapC family toxin [Planctomycetota bacterium]